MKSISLLVIAAVMALTANAQTARRRAVSPSDPEDVSIEFVEATSGDGSLTMAQNNAWLDVGNVFKTDPRERGIHVRRLIGIRLLKRGGITWGTGRLVARLQTWDGRTSVRLDGRELTTAPTLIDARATIGPVIVHRLEIVVPESGRAGPIDASIVWEVTTDR
ncbi:MAG TPA: hypothetical protein VKL19_09710 [Thermoanaerobaculia bacterium]|nr:hypothetical protein [Thermoanaerobaculia bacterium]